MKPMRVRERLSNLPKVSVVYMMRTSNKLKSVLFQTQFATMLCFINESGGASRLEGRTGDMSLLCLHQCSEAETDAVR